MCLLSSSVTRGSRQISSAKRSFLSLPASATVLLELLSQEMAVDGKFSVNPVSDWRCWQSRQSLIDYDDNDMLMGGGVEQSCATHVSGGTGWSAIQ